MCDLIGIAQAQRQCLGSRKKWSLGKRQSLRVGVANVNKSPLPRLLHPFAIKFLSGPLIRTIDGLRMTKRSSSLTILMAMSFWWPRLALMESEKSSEQFETISIPAARYSLHKFIDFRIQTLHPSTCVSRRMFLPHWSPVLVYRYSSLAKLVC